MATPHPGRGRVAPLRGRRAESTALDGLVEAVRAGESRVLVVRGEGPHFSFGGEVRAWADKDVVFLYSGNMGLGHRFTEFLTAARQLGPAGPRWVFSGGGKRRSEVTAKTIGRFTGRTGSSSSPGMSSLVLKKRFAGSRRLR